LFFVDNLTKDLVGVNMVKGLDPGTFRDLVSRMVQRRAAIQNVYEVVGAVEFEYTFWAKPDNESAVRQNLIDVSILYCNVHATSYNCNMPDCFAESQCGQFVLHSCSCEVKFVQEVARLWEVARCYFVLLRG